MRMHVTRCDNCDIEYRNTDERDYSNDFCMVCRKPLRYLGVQNMKPQGLIANPEAKYEMGFEGLE